MTWTVSTIVSEIFYCIIGLFFISNGVKALKDPDCSKKHTTALFWFILAFTFIVGAHLPRWITGACVVLMAALTALRLVAPSKSDVPQPTRPATPYSFRRLPWQLPRCWSQPF